MTASSTPASAAPSRRKSSIGMSVSAPSRLKRFWPRNFVGAGLLEAERIEVRDQVPAHAIHVDELLHGDDLLLGLDGTFERAAIGRPAGRLVRNAEAGEDVVVEAVAAEEKIVQRREEL